VSEREWFLMLGYLPIIALVIALVHIYLDKKLQARSKMIETILLYQLVIATGAGGIFAFMGHAFRADYLARFIGWPAGSPFQFEIAISNLSYGVLGILCFWLRGNFWTATIIATTVFGWGAAYVHIRDIMLYRNMAPGNAGWPLYLDIIMPVIMIGLLIAMSIPQKKRSK
jgi:hypothetical protein